MTREIKWSQWDQQFGMIRCGIKDYKSLMQWMRELGQDASKCLKWNEGKHAVYGRKIYNEQDEVEEIRFYCNLYVTDEELDAIVMDHPRDVLYVAHRLGGVG